MNVKSIVNVLLAWMVVVSHAGCTAGRTYVYSPAIDLIPIHYSVADHLQEDLIRARITEHPMLLSSFVALENLDQTSQLGRLIPQQIGSRLAQYGNQVVDVRLRANTLLVRNNQGEFALSRELQKINQDVNAYSVLAGTYSVVYGRVYVNAMVLRASDGVVLAALDYVLPVNRQALLPEAPASPPPALTRDQLPDPHQGDIAPSVYTRL